jgi:multidrug efflux pump subunit AcrB
VRRALDDAAERLPAGAGAPRLDTAASGTFTAITALTQRPGDPADPALLARMAEDLADRLRACPGTETVEVFGAADEEILVEIDPAALAALGLDTAAVSARIAAADAKMRAGRLQAGPTELLIEVSGAIGDLERIRAVPLAADAGGALVRLGDIARVRRAPLDPPASLAHVDGRPAVLVAARAEPDLRIDRWSARLRAATRRGHRPNCPRGRAPADLRPVDLHRGAFRRARPQHRARRRPRRGGPARHPRLARGAGRGDHAAARRADLALRDAAGRHLAAPDVGDRHDRRARPARRRGHRDHRRDPRRIAAGLRARRPWPARCACLAVPLAASTLTTVLAFAPMALLPGAVGDFVGSIAKSVIIMLPPRSCSR